VNVDQSEANKNMDMPAHVRTYENFMTFTKWSIAFIAIILIAMAIFLV
jgi:hypothetical protein